MTESLSEAQEWLHDRVDAGAHCPCCGQFAKVYKRQINSQMAHCLIRMWQKAGHDWVRLSTLGVERADEAKLVYWGLIEEEQRIRSDGGRSGWWRVTDAGAEFIHLDREVPKYAHVYDDRLVGEKFSGPLRNIKASLGDHFDYDDLMSR